MAGRNFEQIRALTLGLRLHPDGQSAGGVMGWGTAWTAGFHYHLELLKVLSKQQDALSLQFFVFPSH